MSALDGLVLIFDVHEDRDGTEDVDDGGHHNECAENLHKVDLTKHDYCF